MVSLTLALNPSFSRVAAGVMIKARVEFRKFRRTASGSFGGVNVAVRSSLLSIELIMFA